MFTYNYFTFENNALIKDVLISARSWQFFFIFANNKFAPSKFLLNVNKASQIYKSAPKCCGFFSRRMPPQILDMSPSSLVQFCFCTQQKRRIMAFVFAAVSYWLRFLHSGCIYWPLLLRFSFSAAAGESFLEKVLLKVTDVFSVFAECQLPCFHRWKWGIA